MSYCDSCQGTDWHAPACERYLAEQRLTAAGKRRPHESRGCRCEGCAEYDRELRSA